MLIHAIPTHFGCPNPSALPFSRPTLQSVAARVASSVSARPRRRANPAKSGDAAEEAALLVHQILRKSGERNELMVATISKFEGRSHRALLPALPGAREARSLAPVPRGQTLSEIA